jgi:hypothetical protein
MNKMLLGIAAVALFAASALAYAQQATTKDQLVGTWKVVTLKATSGDKVSYPLGEQPAGYVSLDFSNASGSGRWTRPLSGILVVCTCGFAGYRTRFAQRANDSVRFPVMRVRQGARQHADEQSLMFSLRPLVQAELKAR